MKFIKIFGFFQLIIFQQALSDLLKSDICYGELGCFTTAAPFSGTVARPLALLPEAPEIIDTRFYLYTRSNQFYPSSTGHDYDSQYFKADKSIKFIIHGFIHNGFKKWVTDMKDAFLRNEDCNVIAVDWSGGNKLPYTQATANTQVVGAEIARLINALIRRHNINPDDVHIVGHSLGAHSAGYAGERVSQKIGRITGLDPAGPYFENTDTAVRLDKSDAKFVDAIHTDGAASIKLGLGLMQMVGHADFYPNGGKNQPNCPPTSVKLLSAIFNFVTFNLDNLEDGAICNHMSAIHYFTDSIDNTDCKYIAYPCNSDDDFNNGKCIYCSTKGCNRMGYKASINNDNGGLYFNTQNGDKFPYCQHEILVTLNSNSLSGQNQARGTFKITLIGDKSSSLPLELDNSDTTFKPASSESRLVASSKYIGENINQVTVSYTKTSNFLSSFLYQDQWSFRNVQVTYGDNQKTFTFCPTQSYIQSGSQVVFNRC